MTIHSQLLRHRIEVLSDREERGSLIRILDDLETIENAMPEIEGTRLAARARWLRDCLNNELSGRLAKAEAST